MFVTDSFLITGGCSVYFLYLARSSNLTYDWLFGGLFLLWSVYILLNLIVLRTVARLEDDGIEVIRITCRVWVNWSELQWAQLTPDKRTLIPQP